MHRFALRQRRLTRSPLSAALLLALVSPLSSQDSAADTTAEPKQLATVTVNAVLDQARNSSPRPPAAACTCSRARPSPACRWVNPRR